MERSSVNPHFLAIGNGVEVGGDMKQRFGQQQQ